MPVRKTASDNRYADSRGDFGTACTKCHRQINIRRFSGFKTNGAYYYFDKSRTVFESCRLEKGRAAGIAYVFLPAVFEIAAFVLFASYVLGVTVLEAAIMGAVLGAVSPAVVVPKMVSLIEKGLGNDKKNPQLILAGASLDDVFVIVLFSSFVGMAKGKGASAGIL